MHMYGLNTNTEMGNKYIFWVSRKWQLSACPCRDGQTFLWNQAWDFNAWQPWFFWLLFASRQKV